MARQNLRQRIDALQERFAPKHDLTPAEAAQAIQEGRLAPREVLPSTWSPAERAARARMVANGLATQPNGPTGETVLVDTAAVAIAEEFGDPF